MNDFYNTGNPALDALRRATRGKTPIVEVPAFNTPIAGDGETYEVHAAYALELPGGTLVVSLGDTGKYDRQPGRTVMAFRVSWNPDDGPVYIVQTGKDWRPSPMIASDGPESAAGLLGFVALQPGDTDPEFFEDWDDARLDWANAHAEDLSVELSYMEEADTFTLLLPLL